jgi:Uma2 family endonuclease
MVLQHEHWVSIEEYLEIDRKSDIRYEYDNGRMYAMAGGTQDHEQIAFNLRAILNAHLRGKPCRASSSDRRVQINASGKYYYPDVTVTCNPEDIKGNLDIIRFPHLVVEVLSPSTAYKDRGSKRRAYQACPSIEEYMIISTAYQEVEIFRRQGDIWTNRWFGPGQEIELATVSLWISFADLYDLTEVPEQAEE